jgi:hypothetical protein
LAVLCGLLPAGAATAEPNETETRRQVAATPSLLADLPPQVRSLLDEHREALANADAPTVLETVFRVSTPYDFSGGSLVVRTDPRWFATMPRAGDGGALLELRRWPGDSVLALYAIAAPTEDPASRTPPIAAAELTLIEGASADLAAWEGWIETPAGDRPTLWIERKIADGQAWLGALLLPGDAGLGATGIAGLTEEMMGVLRHVEIRPAPWKIQPAIPVGVSLEVPVTAETPGDGNEELTPWQVARAQGFTMGLPPGFRARRMDGGVPPPRELPGGKLWFRGRCVDSDGVDVAVGDENRFGYVARVDDPEKDWTSGTRAPLGAQEAKRLDIEAFALLMERTKAQKATAERWAEPGFAGQWLVFRIRFGDHGYEIAMPVLSGRTSPSLYWIPATWRDESRPPAPPPVDPAERFGIKFERLTRADRQKQPWMEGYLTVPGLRAEVSRGWMPAASLRSEDGYPIRFVDMTGRTVGVLTRIDVETMKNREASLGALTSVDKPGRFRAERVYRDEDRSRLFVSPEGHGFLFELTPPGPSAPRSAVDELHDLWDLMMRSVRLSPA